MAEGAACVAGTEQPQGSPQRSSELKLLVGLKSQQYTGLDTRGWGTLLPTGRDSSPSLMEVPLPRQSYQWHTSHCLGGRATISFVHVLPMFESREGLQISQENALKACSPSIASTDLCLSQNVYVLLHRLVQLIHMDVEKKSKQLL